MGNRVDALCQFIKRIVHSKDPKKHLRDLEKISDVIFPCKPSKKQLIQAIRDTAMEAVKANSF